MEEFLKWVRTHMGLSSKQEDELKEFVAMLAANLLSEVPNDGERVADALGVDWRRKRKKGSTHPLRAIYAQLGYLARVPLLYWIVPARDLSKIDRNLRYAILAYLYWCEPEEREAVARSHKLFQKEIPGTNVEGALKRAWDFLERPRYLDIPAADLKHAIKAAQANSGSEQEFVQPEVEINLVLPVKDMPTPVSVHQLQPNPDESIAITSEIGAKRRGRKKTRTPSGTGYAVVSVGLTQVEWSLFNEVLAGRNKKQSNSNFIREAIEWMKTRGIEAETHEKLSQLCNATIPVTAIASQLVTSTAGLYAGQTVTLARVKQTLGKELTDAHVLRFIIVAYLKSLEYKKFAVC